MSGRQRNGLTGLKLHRDSGHDLIETLRKLRDEFQYVLADSEAPRGGKMARRGIKFTVK